MSIAKEDFERWSADPVTKALREILNHKREVLRQQWEGGSFTDYTVEGTSLTNVANLGTCKAYAFVQELTEYDAFTSELDDARYRE